MVERVSNRKWLPVPWLRMESAIPSSLQFRKDATVDVLEGERMQNHSSLFSLFPYTQITRTHHFTCIRRGSYTLNTVTMTFGDLLGIVKKHKVFETPMHMLVTPRPLPLEELPLPAREWLGETVVRRWIVPDPFLFSGARPYQSGDPMHTVHWKATARTNELQVHRKDFTADYSIMICLNVEDREEVWKEVIDQERIEQLIRACSAVAFDLTDKQVPVGFACNGYDIETKEKRPLVIEQGSGAAHLDTIQEQLAKLKIEPVVHFYELLEKLQQGQQGAVDYLIVTSVVNSKVLERIERLRGSGSEVQLLDMASLGFMKEGA
ncbi:DUF58 domain-containing protein [Marinicrinis lubricantis]|uniref:DUF58 domain-containing protein n=1 Tax=Marinicrinis lubricantis TaxID=2086470 RepID=A0ABW1IMK6_9BACL